MDTFEPIENINTVLKVQHPHKTRQHTEDSSLSSTKTINDQSWFVTGGQPRDAVHEVNTVGDGDTEMGPVGTEDDLDHVLDLSHLQLETHRLISGCTCLCHQCQS